MELHSHGQAVTQGRPGDAAEGRCGVVERVAVRGLLEDRLRRLVVDQSGRVVVLDSDRREEGPVDGHLVDVAAEVGVVRRLSDLKRRGVAHVARHASAARAGRSRVDVDADPGAALPADHDVMPGAIVHAARAVDLARDDAVLEVGAQLPRVVRVVRDRDRPRGCRVLFREQAALVVCRCLDERLGREVIGPEIKHAAGRIRNLDEVVAAVDAGAGVGVRGECARHAEHDAVLVYAVAVVIAGVGRRRARGLAEPPIARGGVGHYLVVIRGRPGGIGVSAHGDDDEDEQRPQADLQTPHRTRACGPISVLHMQGTPGGPLFFCGLAKVTARLRRSCGPRCAARGAGRRTPPPRRCRP